MNILMIVVEDWSTEAIGVYGNPDVQTPHVDRLAATGVMFSRAYCQAPVCNPSRASFVTGLRPDSTGVYGNGEKMDATIPEGAPSMADILSRRPGVYLATVGKMVHKWNQAERFAAGYDRLEYTHRYDRPDEFSGELLVTPTPEGGPLSPEEEIFFFPDLGIRERLIEQYEARNEQLAAGAEETWALMRPFQQLFAEQVGDSGLPEEMMEDGRIARSAVEQLHALAESGEPFFFSVGFYAPHTPLLAPRTYVDLYDPEDMDLSAAPVEADRGIPAVARRNGRNYDIFNGLYPEFGPTEERQRAALAAYYACSSYVDAQVGLVLDALETTGLAENTIVVFFADHGFQLGEHGLWSKFTLFEQSTRVPFIIRVPGASVNGQRSDELVELVDVLPTLCDFWGLSLSPLFEGISLTPLLENPDRAIKRAAFSMIPINGLGRSVRTKQFRYSEWRRDRSLAHETPAAEREFYDLSVDPWEQINRIDDPLYAEQIRIHEAMLKAGWSEAIHQP